MRRPIPTHPAHRWQRPLDVGGAVALGLLAAPVLLLAALAVRLTSRGPVLYTQTRLGRHGRPFRIVKLRTMAHDCEVRSGIRWATRRDPRVTPVGRVLRRLHLDELPQVWNVLAGEMSLVGPRPERPEIVDGLLAAVPGYTDRLVVRPGLTGLAQIQLPADDSVASVRRKLRYDRAYIAGRGVWLDARVLLATAAYLLGVPYPGLRRLFALPGPHPAVPAAAPAPAAPQRVPV